MLADLTHGNKNVYHELGYLMGLNTGHGLPQDNFILLVRNRSEEDIKKSIGFNISHLQQLRFNEMTELEARLQPIIEKHYNLIT